MCVFQWNDNTSNFSFLQMYMSLLIVRFFVCDYEGCPKKRNGGLSVLRNPNVSHDLVLSEKAFSFEKNTIIFD